MTLPAGHYRTRARWGTREQTVAGVYRRHHQARQDLLEVATWLSCTALGYAIPGIMSDDHVTALIIAALTLRLAEAEFNDLAAEQAANIDT